MNLSICSLFILFILHWESESKQNSEFKNELHFALDMNNLHHIQTQEHQLIPLLQNAVTLFETESPSSICKSAVLKYLDEYAEANDLSAAEGTIESKESPFYAFKTILRMGQSLSETNATCTSQSGRNIDSMLRILLITNLPSKSDMKTATQGMLRLQETYGMSAKLFAEGRIGEFHFNQQLSFNDMLVLAKEANDLEIFDVSIEWLALAVDSAPIEFRTNISRTLDESILGHNKKWSELENSSEFKRAGLFTEPVGAERDNFPLKTYTKLRQMAARGIIKQNPDLQVLNICAGQNFQTDEEKSELKCWYEPTPNPYFFISPLKVEILSANPRINLRMIHDVLGNLGIAKLLNQSVNKMRRATVTDDSKNVVAVTNERTSLQTRLNIKDTPYLIPLFQKIQSASDLDVISKGHSEDLQISEYGYMGSHFDMHYDAQVTNVRDKKDKWRRGTTFMVYLTDVHLGGQTVFPLLGLGVQPIKGAAVIWNNVDRTTGSFVRESLHSGCPVAFGRKVIATKWINLHSV